MNYLSNERHSQKFLPQLLKVSPAIALSSGLLLAICPGVLANLEEANQSVVTSADLLTQIADTATVTGIELDVIEAGVQVNLQTEAGSLPAPQTEVVGNALIVDIPNAVLALPDEEEFFASNPAEGIALITASTLDDQTLRLTITGADAPPAIAPSVDGLTFTVSLGVAGAVAADDAIVLGVEGAQDNDYVVPTASTVTRINTPIEEIPRSIQVIPQTVFEDQAINALDDALRNASGVLQNSADARGQRFVIRGFDSSSVLRDGFRPTFGFSGNIGYPELANIEQVEVLKGPAAILYGVSEPGGVINLVSEQPLSDPFYEANFEIGNREQVAAGIDFSGPLDENGNVLYRLNALYRDGAYYRDFDADVERAFIAPVVQWNISDRTDLNLFLEYSDEQRPYDTGLVAIGDGIPDIPFDRNLSQLEDINEATYFRTGYQFEHRFSDNWRLRNAFNYIAYNTIFESSFTLNVDEDTGDITRSFIQLDQPSSTYEVQTNVVGEFSTGSIDHTVLFGVDYNHREQVGNTGRGFATNFTQNIFDPVYGTVARPDFDSEPLFFDSDSFIDAVGIYGQDQISILDNLHVLAGLRYETVSQRNVNRPSLFASEASEETQSDDAFVPQLGIVYQPIEPISLYASYSQSFAPNSGTNADKDVLPPEEGEQFEIGVRGEAFDGRLIANLAYFDITKSNVATSDPNNPAFSINSGEQSSQGVELDVIGEILPGWNIIANYAYTDARISANNDGQEGNRLINSPQHSANLWTTYELQTGSLQGLSFGLGVNYVGDRFGDLDNSFKLGDYFLTNAAIAYEKDTWRAALNVRNLFDVDYITGTRNSRNEIFPGEGLTILGTLSVEF